ncbi:MAG: TRL domain-containing protein [Myxococcota bacterium]
MPKLITALAILVASVPLSGCVTMSSQTGNATYMGHAESLDVTEMGKAEKAGQTCSQNIAGIVSLGDSSIGTAKKQAGINQIVTVDTVYTGYGRLYGKICTTVRGI